MPSAKTVWGIDVGQCALKALKLQWRDGKLRALAFDVIEHAKILSQPDADEQALIRAALGKFLSRNSIKGSTLVISVPGQASFTRFIKLPPVEAKKIPEIVRYEARQQIPFNLEEVVWDYQTISPASAGPREVEVGIFAMKRDIVADYVSDFLAMRIEPDTVQMAPVALYNFLRYDKKEGGGATILIDVGAENTNLVIADGERVWIRNVPLGGNNFTQALCKEFKLPFSKAENLKRHAAESKHARQVFQAMRPVFGDLLTEIQRSIGYYTSLHRDSRIERVIAMGNAFRLAGLTKFISQNLGVEVTKIEGFTTLADSETLQAPLFRENVLSFGVAFGLAVQGLGVATIATSLLPQEILSAKVMRRKRPYFVVAGAALLVAVACFGYDQYRAKGELAGPRGDEPQVLANGVSGIQAKNAEQQGKFDEQKKALVAQQAKIDDIEGLLGDQAYVYDVLRTVQDAWPYDVHWPDWDPDRDRPPRTSLKVIEMLSLTAHYVPDVRTYSEAAGAGGAGIANITVLGMGPAPGETPPAEGGAAVPPPAAHGGGGAPGILIDIVGLTPQTGQDGQALVNEMLTKLKACKRTVECQSPQQPREVLARIPLAGPFRTRPEYQEAMRAVPRPAARGTTPVPEKKIIDRGNDYWFNAQWLVHLGPLSEGHRKHVFAEIVRITQKAGLGDPRKIDPAKAKELDAEKLKGLDQEAAALANTWLVTRDMLSTIAAEGTTKEWPREAPPAAL